MQYQYSNQKNLIHDILDLTDKPTIPGHCGFPLANLQSVTIVDFVMP